MKSTCKYKSEIWGGQSFQTMASSLRQHRATNKNQVEADLSLIGWQGLKGADRRLFCCLSWLVHLAGDKLISEGLLTLFLFRFLCILYPSW